jgi:hypothetical protein
MQVELFRKDVKREMKFTDLFKPHAALLATKGSHLDEALRGYFGDALKLGLCALAYAVPWPRTKPLPNPPVEEEVPAILDK